MLDIPARGANVLASKGANGATDKKPTGDALSKEKLKGKVAEKS